METDVIIQFGIFFFCIALLTFWFKKRWKKKPEQKARSYPENEAEGKWNKSKDMSSSEDWVVGGKWSAERPEPEPPERSKEPESPGRSKEPEPEPPGRSKEPEPEPPERSKEPEPPENEPKE